MRTLLLALVFGLSASGAASAFTASPQFDLLCTAKDEAGETTTERLSVDLDKKAWCVREDGKCAIATLFGVEGDVVIFESTALETGSYDRRVDRRTGAYQNLSSIPTPPIKTEARGRCTEAPFTAFGVELNDAAKAARN